MDDWELSAEELDFLERDALRQLAERNSSSAAATTSYSNINSNSSNSHVPSSRLGIVPSSRSPAKPAFLSCPPATNHTVPNSLQSISQVWLRFLTVFTFFFFFFFLIFFTLVLTKNKFHNCDIRMMILTSWFWKQINASPPARRMLPSSVAPKLTG